MPTEHPEAKQESRQPDTFDQICAAALDNDPITLIQIKRENNTIDIQRNGQTPAQALAGMGEEKAVDCLITLGADKKAIATAYASNGYPQAIAMYEQYKRYLAPNEIAECYAQKGYWELAEVMRRVHKASVNAIAAGYARGGHEALAELMRIRHKAHAEYIIHAYIEGDHILPLATLIGRLNGKVDLENDHWQLLQDDLTAISRMLTFCHHTHRMQLITTLKCKNVIPLTFDINELTALPQELGNVVAAYPTINFEQAAFHDAINFLLCSHLLPNGISCDLQNIIASYLVTTHVVSPQEINKKRKNDDLVKLSRSDYAANFFHSWQHVMRNEPDINKAMTVLVKQTVPGGLIPSIIDKIKVFSKDAGTRTELRRVCAQRHSDPFAFASQLKAISDINEVVPELTGLILFIIRESLIAQARTESQTPAEHSVITVVA